MGKRLLVVDSDRRFIQDHKSPLESAFEVDFLYATEGALARLESGQYGAILLCVETSENKGYALCMAIRRSSTASDVKIALISAKASEEEYARHRGTKGKADLYLHKPITSTALIPTLAAFVPMREDDPDNPLGDLGGADLGDEWLESLRSELEVEGSPLADADPVEPLLLDSAPVVPAPITAIQVGQVPKIVLPAPERLAARNEGEIELLEWRVKDLELKLAAQHDELERKTREIEDLIQRNAAVTRNLDEAQQSQNEAELLKRKILSQDDALGKLQDELQEALNEQKRLVDQLEEVNVLLSEKTQQNADLMESHQLLQAQLEEAWEMGDRVRVLEGSLAEAQEAARAQEARAQQELADKLGRLKALEDEVSSVREQNSFQELTIRNLADERSSLQADRDRLSEEGTAFQHQIATLESSSQAALRERDHLLELGEQLERSVSNLEQQLEAQGSAHENQQRELLAGIDEREAHLSRLNVTLDSQRERISQLEHDKAELESRLQVRDAHMQTFTTLLTELEGKAHQALDLAKAVTN